MKNRVAVVTGGVRGLGKSISKKLLDEGATVIALDINQGSCEKWAKEMKSEGYKYVDAYKCDISSFEQCRKVIEIIIEKYGKIDILVNNAGIIKDKVFRKMDKAIWDMVMKVNLDGLFNMSRNVIENMLKNKYGRIINIASVNGQKGAFGQANYASTKAAALGFTKTIALETASKGITVNAVAPGYCNTEMMQGIPEDIMKKIIAEIPVGRLGEPKEIADAVAFLASDNAGFITGSTISINGGQYMS
ncbi:MAG: beta-ketoacyl-ACP reductase [Victivallales bacterium]|nr:beta-ketoacyl-ACP reductase [Victivallales bacterium]